MPDFNFYSNNPAVLQKKLSLKYFLALPICLATVETKCWKPTPSCVFRIRGKIMCLYMNLKSNLFTRALSMGVMMQGISGHAFLPLCQPTSSYSKEIFEFTFSKEQEINTCKYSFISKLSNF